MSGYVSNVPLSNQSLGQTQPTINTNFTVLNTNFGVDHVDFTNLPPASGGNGGRHNTVTLVQQGSDPTAASNAPILYSKQTTYPSAVTKTDIYMRQASGDGGSVMALSSFFGSVSTSTNGSSFLPGIAGASSAGLQLKYGMFTASGGGTMTITYTALSPALTAFPNNTYAVFVQAATNNGAAPFVTAVSPTSFTIRGFSTPSFNYYFLAIGN